jgi:RNA-binding protein
MTELSLTRDERLHLKARAHHLNAVVLLGAAGLTDPVLREIDRALAAHGLIKVRVPGDDRHAREAMAVSIADRLGAARVGAIGKLLILYRPVAPDKAAGARPPDRGITPAHSPSAPARPPGAARRPRPGPAGAAAGPSRDIRQSRRPLAPRRAPRSR